MLNRLKDMKEEQEDLFKPDLVKADDVNQIDLTQMLIDSVFTAMKSFYVGATVSIDRENKRVLVEFTTR